MAIILGLLGVFYLCVAIICLTAIFMLKKKDILSTSDLKVFFYIGFGITVLDFFISNHLAMFTGDSSVLAAIGYSAVPITQASVALISYSLLQILNKKNNKENKYTPYLLGSGFSAACAYGVTAALSPMYWEFLGKTIYG